MNRGPGSNESWPWLLHAARIELGSFLPSVRVPERAAWLRGTPTDGESTPDLACAEIIPPDDTSQVRFWNELMRGGWGGAPGPQGRRQWRVLFSNGHYHLPLLPPGAKVSLFITSYHVPPQLSSHSNACACRPGRYGSPAAESWVGRPSVWGGELVSTRAKVRSGLIRGPGVSQDR